MMTLWPAGPGRNVRNILCIGAHCDDIEIGCGGTLLSMLDRDDPPAVTWVVLASNAQRKAEGLASANAMLARAKHKDIVIADFRDGFLPYLGEAVKEFFEQLKPRVSPDLIFTHCRDDRHQDHRLACELTWNTFRDHAILEYEVPKFDGDFGAPNAFVHLEDEVCERKIANVMEHFRSQQDRRWFTPDMFRAVLRLRGMESNAPSGYAEAFYARKLVLF
jgi:LmbE family N-acetylglucosaminyl deacetylase